MSQKYDQGPCVPPWVRGSVAPIGIDVRRQSRSNIAGTKTLLSVHEASVPRDGDRVPKRDPEFSGFDP